MLLTGKLINNWGLLLRVLEFGKSNIKEQTDSVSGESSLSQTHTPSFFLIDWSSLLYSHLVEETQVSLGLFH